MDAPPEMLCERLPTEGCTRTLLPVSILRSVVASQGPTPASLMLLEMSANCGMSSSP